MPRFHHFKNAEMSSFLFCNVILCPSEVTVGFVLYHTLCHATTACGELKNSSTSNEEMLLPTHETAAAAGLISHTTDPQRCQGAPTATLSPRPRGAVEPDPTPVESNEKTPIYCSKTRRILISVLPLTLLSLSDVIVPQKCPTHRQ